ncbi:hypothetical protein IMCC14465_04930 [alpha proteobacterium IMCC14465]|uniref:Uncharacterized protein n=1 Tax=alpha proteobacterium IMCC14465 TaxID=1220535 RepID=J9E2L5_9PROT|nr:hypothetical protein IMCC14465_04930 [alpha proteobacterium IMCC14465]
MFSIFDGNRIDTISKLKGCIQKLICTKDTSVRQMEAEIAYIAETECADYQVLICGKWVGL